MALGVCSDGGEGRPRSVFERFTDRARLVVVQAQNEARALDHNYIGTEHLLLGLIHGDGVGPKVLESMGITREAIRHRVEEITGRGPQAPSGHIPFTPQAKRVLESSLAEARALGHGYVGSEHILLGLIRSDDVAGQVLLEQGVDLDAAREWVTRLLDQYRREQGNQTG
jgi:ATP-dependent Clp protease ATP-binding subunit ClpC